MKILLVALIALVMASGCSSRSLAFDDGTAAVLPEDPFPPGNPPSHPSDCVWDSFGDYDAHGQGGCTVYLAELPKTPDGSPTLHAQVILGSDHVWEISFPPHYEAGAWIPVVTYDGLDVTDCSDWSTMRVEVTEKSWFAHLDYGTCSPAFGGDVTANFNY